MITGYRDRRRFARLSASHGERNITPSTYNVRLVGLRFFFETTCQRPEMKECMHFRTEPRKLPVVFSAEEVFELLRVAPGPGLKYRAVLSILYGTGLRASEVCNLKVTDIDSDRMVIHVERGKGGKDRKVMLSPGLLELLRDYWREAPPDGWLFPGKPRINPLSPRQLHRAFCAAKHLAGIKKPRSTLHSLRHSFATHLLEAGTPSRQHAVHAPAGQWTEAGDCRHLSYLWSCLSAGQCWVSAPEPTAGHVGNRGLSHGSARRTCGSLHQVPSSAHSLQLMQKSALSEVSGTGSA